MLKHNKTYEIMNPESIGLSKSKLVLGNIQEDMLLNASFIKLSPSYSSSSLAFA